MLRRAVILIGSVFFVKLLNILFDNLLNIHIQSRLQGIAIFRGNRFLLILLILIQVARIPSWTYRLKGCHSTAPALNTVSTLLEKPTTLLATAFSGYLRMNCSSNADTRHKTALPQLLFGQALLCILIGGNVILIGILLILRNLGL